MPVYSVNRRRAIILLVLSSVLLLTLDLNGNPLIDRMRSYFAIASRPFENAADVIATPIRNAWHGATDWQDLQRENERLQARIDQQNGDDLANRAAYSDLQELQALSGLNASYLRITARVVGGAPGNFRQTVEIDRGKKDGILVGMAVVNSAGLVGRITQADDDRSVVLLMTDEGYVIPCKVSEALAPSIDESTTTVDTTSSGVNRSDLDTTTTTIPPTTTTIADPSTIEATAGTDPTGTDPLGPDNASPDTSTTVAPTPTTLVLVERETGGCYGRGVDKLPAMKFVTDNPVFGGFGVGDVITTTGGSSSLAPPDLVIGEVVNKVNRTDSQGPLLEIQLAADFEHLHYVQILLYVPPSEVPGG